MNLTATSKEDILKASRTLIQQNGWAAVNIRAVAAACGVSVGCIYNYFGSKTELVSATVESIWNDIFHRPEDEAVFRDTLACVRWMYRQLEYGCAQYPGFFTHHSLGFMHQGTADGNSRCSRRGSTSCGSYISSCSRTPTSGRMPSMTSSPPNGLPGSCFPRCCPRWCSRIRPLHGAGDRPSNPLLKNFPRMRGDFLSVKVNIVQQRR